MNEGSYSHNHEGSHSTTTVGHAPNHESEVIHRMDGIPTWMAISGIILIILVSHYLVNTKKAIARRKNYWRLNLFRFQSFKKLVKRPYFPLLAQSLSILTFILIITAGLFGSQRTNIAPVLTWTWWWVLLIFFILGFGTVFCTICPWEGISSFVTSLSLSSRVKKLGFECKWPKLLRNVYPALLFFVILTWFELGFEVTRSPSMTAIMAIVFVAIAVLCALIFEKRGFCRYVCLVGRIQGLYALFSPLELRPQSVDVCRSCSSKACYKGTETETGCPTILFPGNLQENTYCTLCTECVRSCPHDNISINIRPPATDLLHKLHFKWDEAILAIVLLALTSFHGITMTPVWGRINDILRVDLGMGPKPIFTLLMLIMTVFPVFLFWGTAWMAKQLTHDAGIPICKIFRAFAYSVIPIALFYHLAHNGMHFFMEAQNIIPLLSDPFGWGWNLFGTAGKDYNPLLSLTTIWWIQVILIIIGHVYGVIIADRVAKVLFKEQRFVIRSLVPLIVTMILYSSFSVWLIAQPMEMRSGM